MSILLHGEPGTGKTSLIKGLASHFDCTVFNLDFNKCQAPGDFNLLVSSIHSIKNENSSKLNFVLIEDIDCITKSGKDRSKNDSNDIISLSEILNTLDGINSLDNTIIFMSTNDIESLDNALLRKGRTDHLIKITRLSPDLISKQVEFIYNQKIELPKKQMLGCDLQSLIIEHKQDFKEFYKAFLRKQNELY